MFPSTAGTESATAASNIRNWLSPSLESRRLKWVSMCGEASFLLHLLVARRHSVPCGDCPGLSLCCCGRIVTSKGLGEKRFVWLIDYSLSLGEVEAETQGRTWRGELKQRPWRNGACWLPSRFLFSYLSCIAQAHLPRDGTTPGLGPLHQLAVKQIPHRHAHKPLCWRQILSWSSLFQGVSSWQSRLAVMVG